jgi:HK97 family phage prohead protease
MESLNLKLSDCEVKFAKSGAAFEGYASVFNVEDSHRDVVLPGAFTQAIEAKRAVKMYHEHSWILRELPIGLITPVAEDSKGLIVTGEFTPGMTKAADVRAALEHRTVDGLSIGSYSRLKSGVHFNTVGARRHIKAWPLDEVSIVNQPSNTFSRIDKSSIKSALEEVKTVRDLERALRDVGFSNSEACEFIAVAKLAFQGELESKAAPTQAEAFAAALARFDLSDIIPK